ncbi:MAG: glycine cleavage system aminomethyltransferase GcvT [Alphaproteobacteria bacterium]|nr:glycine cleavage system aminomethyltransferase GcvT [Alphaproteobacteria bacterium]
MPNPAGTDPRARDEAPLARTALYDLHRELGAKMVPFAGFEMPVSYPPGIIKEHLHARSAAALFDVSHMGQARLAGGDAAGALETLVPGDICGLAPGRMRYNMLTTEAGGILDDIMVSAADDGLMLVLNAARKRVDIAHIAERLGAAVEVAMLDDRALIALQGPEAAAVLARSAPEVKEMRFLETRTIDIGGARCLVSRAGYTGEDGFEISIANAGAEALARALLAEPEVAPAGLGARDTLRLEAGLCLYGHDIDEGTSPVEADLAWTISKRRRAEANFPGAQRILGEIAAGPTRRRVGIRPRGRAPAREGTAIIGPSGSQTGAVTSGGFGPSVGGPIAMGYVAAAFAEVGTELKLIVRGREVPAQVCGLPFVEHRYFRGQP